MHVESEINILNLKKKNPTNLHFHFFFRRYHFDGVDGRVDVTEQHHGGHERREGRQKRVLDVLGVRKPLQLDFGYELAGGPVVNQRLGYLVLQEQKRFRQITFNGKKHNVNTSFSMTVDIRVNCNNKKKIE